MQPEPGAKESPSPWTRQAFALAVAAAALLLAFKVQHVFFVTLTGVLLAIVLDGLAGLGERFLRLRHTVAVIAAAVVSLAIFSGVVALIAVPLVKQGQEFARTLPEKSEELRRRVAKTRADYPALARVLPALDGAAGEGASAQETKETAKGAAKVLHGAVEGFFALVSVFFLAIFLALDPRRYLEGFARLIPGAPHEDRLELLGEMGDALRSYLVALGINIVAMAVLWAIGLKLIGIEYWLLFGVVGGVVEIVPYIGPLAGMVPPLAVAAGMGGTQVVLVVVLYAVLHVVEGYILVPLIMQNREKLPPPVTLVSILAAGAAFGFWGILLAVPLGTIAYVWVRHALPDSQEEEGGATIGACPQPSLSASAATRS